MENTTNNTTNNTTLESLFELRGRVAAVHAYCAAESYPNVQTIKAILGLTDAADERLAQLEAENNIILARNYELRTELEELKNQSAEELAEIIEEVKAVGDGE